MITTVNEKLIEISVRLDEIEKDQTRLVNIDQLAPVKEQTIENKNRINENIRQLQAHEVAINTMKMP